ncbi:LysR family transcriptional regulator [Actinomadura sp. ATCC 31491]|uniref:LysR family transcriptional regulator n=1 Tax=Actinomadura luzonensis TaxID=2805427 RepID=A0ABT0G8I1_9ACTN|nr:LysR family transcriptional regulator [Actinomadura luzonensis]MCK2220728.1 LysR family transcriptional regulator [Actinomadura luzonensis]
MRQTQPSLDLLVALDVLLEEGSVSAAAHRLHLSEPAMSRTLGRIRKAMGDPVLVRSGRQMVPTPRALAVREEVRGLVEAARRVFTPPGRLDPATLVRRFVILASDAVITAVALPLLSEAARSAPGVTLHFLPEGHGDQHALREGSADLEVTVVEDPAPETRVEPLMRDRAIGVVRPGHPLLSGGPVTLERLAAGEHVIASRRGRMRGPVDEALAARGLERRIAGSVPTFGAALLAVRESDLVGMTPERLTAPLVRALGLVTFPIPLELPSMTLSQAWHPRYDADPAHAWLREQVREALTTLDPDHPPA